MECPKCGNTDGFDEYRIEVTVYRYRGEEYDDELALEESCSDETLLPLAVSCNECDYVGSLSEFGADRRNLINPLEIDSEGSFVTYLIAEAKIKIYPKDKLLKDIQEQLEKIPNVSQLPSAKLILN